MQWQVMSGGNLLVYVARVCQPDDFAIGGGGGHPHMVVALMCGGWPGTGPLTSRFGGWPTGRLFHGKCLWSTGPQPAGAVHGPPPASISTDSCPPWANLGRLPIPSDPQLHARARIGLTRSHIFVPSPPPSKSGHHRHSHRRSEHSHSAMPAPIAFNRPNVRRPSSAQYGSFSGSYNAFLSGSLGAYIKG